MPGVLGLLSRAASVPGLSAVDLNFPDHLEGVDLKEMKRHLDGLGLSVNGFAMRYYSDPGFKIGAFTNPDAHLRRLAIDQTKRGIDQMLELGGSLMTLWMGQTASTIPSRWTTPGFGTRRWKRFPKWLIMCRIVK